MHPEARASELAHRLTQAGAGRFRAEGGAVVLEGVADGTARLQVIDAGGGRAEQVAQALGRARASEFVPVIVGRRFAQKALDELDAAGANYMDDRHLKVRLHAPDILIRLQDQAPRPQERQEKALQLSGTAGGIAIALLTDPSREWKVSDLATEGLASLGAAHDTVVALEVEGLLERIGTGPATRRRVTNPSDLLDRYAGDAAADRRVIARGYLVNSGPEETMRSATRRLAEEAPDVSAWFTGVAAAQLVTPHLTNVRVFEAWITTPYRADLILAALGAMPVDEGANLVVMQGRRGVVAGSEFREGIRTVSVFRMYADALADPARGEEQAEYLREKIIGF